MKFKMFILLLLFFTYGNGQNNGTLFFKDGTVKEGFVKFTAFSKIKFKASKKSKWSKYDFSTFSKIEIMEEGELTTYVEILARGNNGPQIVKELVKGKITLYHLSTVGTSMVMNPATGASSSPSFTSYNIKNLYVKREQEKVATHLGSNQLFTKNFKKAASEFFKDCSVLVVKIQQKEFKKRDIEKIVKFYNEECD